MPESISSSALAVQALEASGQLQKLNIGPFVSTATVDCACSFCGAQIKAGTACNKTQLGPSFTDQPNMADRHAPYICPECCIIRNVTILRKGGYGAYSAAGAFQISKMNALSYVLQTPPEPPFLLVYRPKNPQHMIWMTPVSYSKSYFAINYLRQVLYINRAKMKEGMACIQTLNEAAKLLYPNSKAKLIAFVRVDCTMQSRNSFEFRNKLLEAANDTPELLQALNTIRSMRLADLWAAVVSLQYPPDPDLVIPIEFEKKDTSDE